MKKANKFSFPRSIVNQIDSCSKGYFLVTINEMNEFEIFQSLPDTLSHLGMLNFLEIYSSAAQENARNQGYNSGNTRDDED